jgi:protein SCO1/2
MRLGAVLAILVLAGTPAMAGLPRNTLHAVEAAPSSDARLDLSLSAPDTNGQVRSIGQILGSRTGFVSFVDYTCNTLCGTDLMLLADGVARAGLDPSRFRIIVIGLDPKDSAAAARRMEDKEIPSSLRRASLFLLPDATTVKAATDALGFGYAYDAAADQFAHPAAVYVVGPGGRVRSVLSPLALTALDLNHAMTAGSTPSLLQRIHSLCYAYDPLTGVYNLRVTWLLRVGALITLVLLSLGILVLVRRRGPWT